MNLRRELINLASLVFAGAVIFAALVLIVRGI